MEKDDVGNTWVVIGSLVLCLMIAVLCKTPEDISRVSEEEMQERSEMADAIKKVREARRDE
ncbi:hypothetical protein NSQ26_05890 [Bacillus sp. FSL W7-1360]